MSWWEAAGFSNLAQQALKTAQKKIDKVLDIKEENADLDVTKSLTSTASKTSAKSNKRNQAENFWNNWSSPTDLQKTENKDSGEKSQQWNQWNWWNDDSAKLENDQTKPKTEEIKAVNHEKLGGDTSTSPLSSGPKSPTKKGTSLKLGTRKKSPRDENEEKPKGAPSLDSSENIQSTDNIPVVSDLTAEGSMKVKGIEEQFKEKNEHNEGENIPKENLDFFEEASKPQQIGEWMDKCEDFAQSMNENIGVKETFESYKDETGSAMENNTAFKEEEKVEPSQSDLGVVTENMEGPTNTNDCFSVDILKAELPHGQVESDAKKQDNSTTETLQCSQIENQSDATENDKMFDSKTCAQARTGINEHSVERDTKEQEEPREEEEAYCDQLKQNQQFDNDGAEPNSNMEKSEEETTPGQEEPDMKSESNNDPSNENVNLDVTSDTGARNREAEAKSKMDGCEGESTPGQDEPDIKNEPNNDSCNENADLDVTPDIVTENKEAEALSKVDISEGEITSGQDEPDRESEPNNDPSNENADLDVMPDIATGNREDSLMNSELSSILRDHHSMSSISTSSDTSSTITVNQNYHEQKESSDSSITSDTMSIKIKSMEESGNGSDGAEANAQRETDKLNSSEGGNSELEENQKVESDTSGDTVTAESVSIPETKHDGVPVVCEDEDKHSDAAAMAQSMVSSSSSSSFVKCMIDDAMAESTKTEDLESPVSSEKSDLVKVESSQNSGHTSGDEMDTTNSSDIEILSIPTPNGDGKEQKPFDLSPLRQALSRSVRSMVPGHRRNDSHDSQCSSTDRQSPENIDRLDLIAGKNTEKRRASSKGFSSDENDDPYHPQKLLKSIDPSLPNTELAKKLAETAEILEARENKLLQQSKENMDLSEENSILRNQLQQMQKSHEEEMTDVTSLSEEFGQRLTEMEKKLQAAYRERDNMKKQLSSAEEELKKKIHDRQTIQLMREKDEQITELLAEGEKLSKQQLQSNNIIKKLRSKEKESESLIKSKKQKVEDQAKEISHLKEVLDSKEDLEKKQSDAINQLNAAVQKQEKEIWKLKSELDDSLEKNRSLQTILDSSYKEIIELKKANIAKESEAQELALSTEMQAKEELRLNLEKQQQQAKMENESLMMQVEDLRMGLSRMEKEYGRREDMLRQEISDAHQRLQEAESRNNTLTQSVSVATRPLLRQIENLQSTYSAQSSSWEGLEKNLTERLHDAQSQLAVAVERERTASEKVLELQAKVSALETQNASLRQEKSRLMAQYEMEKAKVETLEDSKNSESVQYEAMRHNLEKELGEVRKEKVLVENQLEMEKLKLEAEKKKLLIAHDQLHEKELQLARQSPKAPSPAPISASRQHSFSSSVGEAVGLVQDDVLERTLHLAAANGSKTSLYESLRQSGAASVMENLQAQLKQKDGEVLHLQDEITQLERTREAMARELVDLSTKNEELEVEVKELPEIRQKFADLDQRYNALLQMYGEKVEEADELRMDLHDVKDLYKSQIDLLLMNQSS